MRDTSVFEFIATLMSKQFRFIAALVAIGVAGIVYGNGWSWTSAVVIVIALLVLSFGWALVSFWVWFFRNAGRQKDAR